MKAKKWILAKQWNGVPNEENLQLIEEEIPDELKRDEVLLQAVYLSVDPYMRIFTDHLNVGDVMIGEQLAEVIKTKNGKFPLGSLLLNNKGWVSHFISDGSDLNWIQFDLNGSNYSYCLSVLGMPGASAYAGLVKLCEPKAGDTVLVNGAAGAVGCLVGQLAKLRGCKVIAFAGSNEKVSWCKNELNFDFVYNYKNVKIDEVINEAAPAGVDIFFDNVGGKFYNSVISNHIKKKGRVCICGSIENYNQQETKNDNDLSKIIAEREIQIKQLNVFEHKKEWPLIFTEINKLLKEGKIKYRETRYDGIEKMRDAFYGLFKGENIGKAIVKAHNSFSHYKNY